VSLELIRNVPLFAELAADAQKEIAPLFHEEVINKGSNLFERSKSADAIYLVKSGFVRLINEDGLTLATLGPGSLLGEAEFLRGDRHPMTAVAVGDVTVLRMTDSELRTLIQRRPNVGLGLSQSFGEQIAQMEDYLTQRLAGSELLGDLPPNLLRAVAAHMYPRTVEPSTMLYRAGEPPQGLFLLEAGKMEIQSEDNQPPRHLRSGDLFGSLSLLTNKPYSATAWAEEESLVWQLPTPDFYKLSSNYPELRRTLGQRIRSKLSSTDQTQAVIQLARTPIFESMEPQNLHAIAQRLVLHHVPAGESVYRSGDPGDGLFLVEQGEIELTAENRSGVVEEIGRIESGGFFGEMSLLTGKNRTDDATATRNTNLWVLYKTDLDELVGRYPSIGSALNQVVASRLAAQDAALDEGRYRRFPLFANLSHRDLREVSRYLRPTRFRAGEQIFRAGTPGTTLFLVEQGHVRMQPLAGGRSWVVSSGDIFGEKAVLTNQLHGQSAYAETEIDLLTISREELEHLMMRIPGLAMGLSRILSERIGEMPGGAPRSAEEEDDAGLQERSYSAVTLSSQRRRMAASRQPVVEKPRFSLAEWFSGLSMWARVRFALLVMILVYLFFVAAPMAVSSLLGSGVASGDPTVLSASVLGAADQVESGMRVAEANMLAGEVGAAEGMVMAQSGPDATATYTPYPTNTPIPTATPPLTPPPTPVPPTATFTPVPPTPIPAPVQVQARAAVVEAAPQPEPEPPAPAFPSRAWDGRASALGVYVQDANVGSGQQFWRLIEMRWENEEEAGGRHHIYVETLDENGQRIIGQPVYIFWPEGGDTVLTENKPVPEFALNYPMWKAGNSYNVRVDGLPSDTIQGLGLGTPDLPFHTIHTNYKLTFQRVTMP
jgi:CRP-like cAMP-binding protein